MHLHFLFSRQGEDEGVGEEEAHRLPSCLNLFPLPRWPRLLRRCLVTVRGWQSAGNRKPRERGKVSKLPQRTMEGENGKRVSSVPIIPHKQRRKFCHIGGTAVPPTSPSSPLPLCHQIRGFQRRRSLAIIAQGVTSKRHRPC
ncbi:hypothetical protein GOODEAATRI_023382 [Goodea atripinnis]|uniref:Uncharacterized protein n=1 Tax=Goodea atripinnis TaxID=208336 RepID=A0ABV0MK48_9TELE